MLLTLQTPLSDLRGVGKTVSSRLQKINLKTIEDLLLHIPYRYEDWSKIMPISVLTPENYCTIKAKIELITMRRSMRRRLYITEALVRDPSGAIKVVWFNQPYLTKILKQGDNIFLSGKVDGGLLGYQLVSPIWERAEKTEGVHTGRFLPIYHSTSGITQKQLRVLIKFSAPVLKTRHFFEKLEWFPEGFLKKFGLVSKAKALYFIHFPKNRFDVKHGLDRLKFEELFRVNLIAELNRRMMAKEAAPQLEFKKEEVKNFVESLPFKLTYDQRKAAWDILKDIGGRTPMNRLLEGEVGSGKTVVAAIAAYVCKLNGYQAALMAPTQILAIQHAETFSKLLAPHGMSIGLRTSKTKKRGGLVLDEDLTIGTHAIITEKVKFNKLGLAIVDEQHRFGVNHRKSLKEKSGMRGMAPHFLSLSATPIPRTLALTIWGDLKLSIIKSVPPGRKKVITRVVEPNNREKAYDFIKKKIGEGRQAYVVCPLIDPSDSGGKKSVKKEYERLKKDVFNGITISMLHGKMKLEEKEAVMRDFFSGDTKILVSTSVIEVGINVPNAAVMMIEGAENFGLAQLHQFRGRVSRSLYQGFCLVFTEDETIDTKKRLDFFATHNDGFEIAEFDLKKRGPGDVYGKEQSGLGSLRFATLSDAELIKKSREAVLHVLDVGLTNYPSIAKELESWQTEIHWE